MKIIVISGHPDLNSSSVNREMLTQLQNHDITIHKLSENNANYIFYVNKEQSMLMEYDRIVLMFPLYWYSAPALLKKWIDDVFLPGFAYARNGNKLKGKEMLIVASIGGPHEVYRAGGLQNYTIDELFRPFEQTANYVQAIYLPPVAIYDALFLTTEEIEEKAKRVCLSILAKKLDANKLYGEIMEKYDEVFC